MLVTLVAHVSLHHCLSKLRLIHALLLVGFDGDLSVYTVKVLLGVSKHLPTLILIYISVKSRGFGVLGFWGFGARG